MKLRYIFIVLLFAFGFSYAQKQVPVNCPNTKIMNTELGYLNSGDLQLGDLIIVTLDKKKKIEKMEYVAHIDIADEKVSNSNTKDFRCAINEEFLVDAGVNIAKKYKAKLQVFVSKNTALEIEKAQTKSLMSPLYVANKVDKNTFHFKDLPKTQYYAIIHRVVKAKSIKLGLQNSKFINGGFSVTMGELDVMLSYDCSGNIETVANGDELISIIVDIYPLKPNSIKTGFE